MFKKWVQPTAAATASSAPTADTPRALAERCVQQGQQLEDSGHLEGAMALYRQAIEADPTCIKGPMNLGIALAAAQRWDEAAASYSAALALDPTHPFTLYNWAHLAYAQGNWQQARNLAERALQSKPDFPQALVLLSNALDELNEHEAALEHITQALRLTPEHLPTALNRLEVAQKLSDWGAVEDAARDVLCLQPTHGLAHEALSIALRKQGFATEALQAMVLAGAELPERRDLQSRALFARMEMEDSDAAALAERHRAFGEKLEARVAPRFAGQQLGSCEPERGLTVGLLSADLCMHPVALFLLPLLEYTDRTRLAFHAFFAGKKPDEITQRIQAQCEHWVDVSDMNEDQTAQAIHDSGVDILLDLSGHSSDARLGVYAQVPAPIQVAWIGYLNTTGLSRIHYRLCDRFTDPPETQRFHTERLLHLPHSQWCYQPLIQVDRVDRSPCLSRGHLTFGSFNSAPKISDAMLQRWAALLERFPNARLALADINSERKRTAIHALFEQAGIDPARIECLPRMGLDDYFDRYNQVDLALDTYPYGGGTTTFDALWMGVPVVTAVGSLPCSRSAASLLTPLGLAGWVAPSIDAYVDVAVARAQEVLEQGFDRAGLHARLRASPLTDVPQFARDFEAALRGVWRAHCADVGPSAVPQPA